MALASGALEAAFERLWAGPEPQQILVPLLTLLHQVIRASVPLMEAARDTAGRRAAGDPLCAALVPYLDEHIEEERGHDDWVLEDLESLGVPRAATLSCLPSPLVASLAGAQYYWIAHHHPAALLSYIAVLEASAGTGAQFDSIVAKSGLPDAAFRTLRAHGRLDPGHSDALDRFLDRAPLTREHESLLGVSAFHTIVTLARAVDSLAKDPP
jgi:hypothetical protein